MTDVDLKAMLAKLNPTCTRALEGAAGACVSRSNYEVTFEHFLAALLEDPGSDLIAICEHYDVDVGRLQKAIQDVIEREKTGNQSRPVFAPLLVESLQEGWVVASVEHGLSLVRSGCIFQAILARTSRYCGGEYADLWSDISRHELGKVLLSITAASAESATPLAGIDHAAASGSAAPAPGASPGTALAQFCINFTQRARDGLMDPVFGRDGEIRQMVDILSRRRKNNPMCVGEPGVGKTAVIEGLALRIIEGDVPDILANIELISLDMGLLQAGASVKGEFEKRLKAVIDEVKASVKPIVLFIDEAHTLIGAGGAAGGSDAANLLKPELARGTLKTVAATTWSEYKKYFEKDAALARRFQVVKLDEPDVATTTTMLRGLKQRFEEAHGVIIRDDALVAAAEMGNRYVPSRRHPDKGVDLMDTAAARVKVSLASKPGELEDAERTIQSLERELAAVERDRDNGMDELDERLAEIAVAIERSREREAEIRSRWEQELETARAALDARTALAEAKPGSDEAAIVGAAAAAKQALEQLAAIQDGNPIVHVEVTADTVAQVIASWTGIPLGNMVRDEAKSLLELEDTLTARVKGQDHSMGFIAESIRASKAGLTAPEMPMGVFLLVGPSGTGKTETALTVADMLFGGEQFMTTLNMSEYMEKHNVSRMIGSPPGYVGYGEGGVLTEAVRQRPYQVVLLDEVEKAHPDVMNLFYQVFDKGNLCDGDGNEVDFSNTVLFLTSNLATDIITEMTEDGKKPSVEDIIKAIRPVLNAHFKPALVARMTLVPYYALDHDTLKLITCLKMGKVVKRLAANQKITATIDDRVYDAIADRCTEVSTGARTIDHIINGSLLPTLSKEILAQMTSEDKPSALTIDVAQSGNFSYDFA